MGWEGLIVPIIVVAVWIIGTVIRSNEQAKKGAGQRKTEKVTDLDRFLREVRRRQGQQRQQEQEPSRPAEREEEAVAERARESSPRTKWRTLPQDEVLVALPVEEGATAPPVTGTPVMTVFAAPPLPVMLADTSARSLPDRPESAAMTGLRELLRSREGLRQAMILQEVFGPPVSRRRR